MRRIFNALAWAAMLANGCAASEQGHREITGSDNSSNADTSTLDTQSDSADTGTGGEPGDTNLVPGSCHPGEVWCLESFVAQCGDAGDEWTLGQDCEAKGQRCAAGACRDVGQACADAMNDRSYLGCEYLAVPLANSGVDMDKFWFAVAVANDGEVDATVLVTDGAQVERDYELPAGQMIVIEDLPWKPALVAPGNKLKAQWASRKVEHAAYRLTSSEPVSAYQFNPLHYEAVDGAFSFTNDASLLVPVQAGGDEYMVITRPTMQLRVVDYDVIQGWPGFVAIAGAAEAASQVEVRSKAVTLVSDLTSSAALLPLAPGGTTTLNIEPYAVVQLLSGVGTACDNPVACDAKDGTRIDCCDTPRKFDLTGTTVKVLSGPPPAVFAGTLQSFVPYDKYASDHLEEQMFPLSTWGTRYVCGHTITQRPTEPTVWRVVSGANSNEITFDPESVHNTVTLDKGEFVELTSLADFEVIGTNKLAVAQFMVGQHYSDDPPEAGDPSMALGVPVEQYRNRYTFLAPTTYDANYLTVVHPIGVLPTLDTAPIAGDTVEVGDEYARTNLEITAGIHFIEADEPFGITVYGVGSFTSYMYPGGLNLKDVVVVK